METKQKSLGSIKNLSMSITSPFECKELNLTLNQLTILVGANGSGKSFSMILAFCMNYIMSSYIIQAIIAKQKLEEDVFKKLIQYVLDNSYTDQNIDGILKCNYVSGCTITIEMDKGQVSSYSIYIPDDVVKPTSAFYLSSSMRTFDSISTYLKMRALIQQADSSEEEVIGKLINNYKLYNVVYIEKMIHSVPIHLKPESTKSLKENFDFKDDITEVLLDTDKSDFYYMKGEQKKYLSTLSKGEQAMLNMTLATNM